MITDSDETDHFVVVDDNDALPSVWRTLVGIAFGGVFVVIGLLAGGGALVALAT